MRVPIMYFKSSALILNSMTPFALFFDESLDISYETQCKFYFGHVLST